MATTVVSGLPMSLQSPTHIAMPDPIDISHEQAIPNLVLPSRDVSSANPPTTLRHAEAKNNISTIAHPLSQDTSKRTTSQRAPALSNRGDKPGTVWAGTQATESESESAGSSEDLHFGYSHFNNPFNKAPTSLRIANTGYFPRFPTERVTKPARLDYGTPSNWSSPGSEVSGTWSIRSPADPLQVLWTKLEDKRRIIQDRRTEMASKRRELQTIHRKKDDQDNEFMQCLRPLLLSARTLPRPYEALERRLAELHNLRDEYNSAMSSYEALEKALDQDETELELLERRFFTTLYGVTRGDDRNSSSGGSESEEEAEDRPPSRTSLMGISGDMKEDIHPLYRNLLDAVGDRELAFEHYTDLVAHRDFILDFLETSLKRKRLQKNQSEANGSAAVLSEDELDRLKSTVAHIPTSISAPELRDLFGTSIRDPDLEFLMDFGREEETARHNLTQTTMEVRRLRDLCEAKRAMRKNPPYSEEYTIFVACGDNTSPPPSNMTIHSQALTKPGDGLAHPDFPILLSDPSHVLEPEPQTAKFALRKAVQLPKDDPDRAQRMAQAMKEYDILHLLGETREQDKSDYINRWLLQQLRISPLQVRVLLSTWPARIKIVNVRRWQEDVLYYWTKDEAANQPAQIFDGPLTPDDYIVFANSEIDLDSRIEREYGDSQDEALSSTQSMF